MKRQRTFHVRIVDRVSGFTFFGSLRVERTGRITMNPTPGIGFFTGPEGDANGAMDRIDARMVRLGRVLHTRTFGGKG